jgi:hypothetical protein
MDSAINNEIFRTGPVFSNWQQVYQAYLSMFGGPATDKVWIFRGQSNGVWKLRTRLEREVERAGCPPKEWGHIEEGLVREFQRRLGTADDSVGLPDSDNVLAWMALMQHHGTPTRLLDWTYSFFVALFFAVESAEEDSAVFAIDARWCNRQSRRKLPRPKSIEQEIARDPYTSTSETFRNLFARVPEISLVYRVNPFVLNTRLAVQQGLFLCPGAVSKTFAENLVELHENAKGPLPLHKWTIPRSIHRDVLRELSYMNIGRHSLFPGLDGLAQSLTQHLKQPERLYPRWRRKQKTSPFVGWDRWEPLKR